MFHSSRLTVRCPPNAPILRHALHPRTEVPGDIIRDILAGMEDTETPYMVVEDRAEAICWAMDHAQPGDVIVLAGKGHETYQEVNHQKRHMDEREIVAEHIAACQQK